MMKIKKYNGWELAEEENGPLVKVADVPLVNLQTLYLEGTQISDAAPLAGLKAKIYR